MSKPSEIAGLMAQHEKYLSDFRAFKYGPYVQTIESTVGVYGLEYRRHEELLTWTCWIKCPNDESAEFLERHLSGSFRDGLSVTLDAVEGSLVGRKDPKHWLGPNRCYVPGLKEAQEPSATYWSYSDLYRHVISALESTNKALARR